MFIRKMCSMISERHDANDDEYPANHRDGKGTFVHPTASVMGQPSRDVKQNGRVDATASTKASSPLGFTGALQNGRGFTMPSVLAGTCIAGGTSQPTHVVATWIADRTTDVIAGESFQQA